MVQHQVGCERGAPVRKQAPGLRKKQSGRPLGSGLPPPYPRAMRALARTRRHARLAPLRGPVSRRSRRVRPTAGEVTQIDSARRGSATVDPPFFDR